MSLSEPLAPPLREMLTILVWAAAGLIVVFVILALARLWGWRTQQRGGGCGGIDLEHLRGQLHAGDISQEEYEAVRARIAGAASGKAEARPAATDAEPNDESSIETDGADPTDRGHDPSKRSRTDGET